MLVELIIAVILIVVITALICAIVDGAYVESSLIGIIILIILTQKLESIRLIDTSPIISLAISAFMISIVAIFLSMIVHRLNH